MKNNMAMAFYFDLIIKSRMISEIAAEATTGIAFGDPVVKPI